MGKLKPPKNFRRTTPKACIGCIHRIAHPEKHEEFDLFGSSVPIVCKRDYELILEDNPEFTVCDGFSPARG